MPDVDRIGTLVSREFLEALEAIYPLRSPNIHDSERLIWMKVGEHNVVDFLRAKYEEANANPLDTLLLS